MTGDPHAAAILELLEQRGPGKTICPSEAAKLFGGSAWQGEMAPTRQAAHRLVGEGLIEITQRGRVVDGATAKGPIRLRLREKL